MQGNLGHNVWNITEDSTNCQSEQEVHISPEDSGIDKAVPPLGSAKSLPQRLRPTAMGGVLISMERPVDSSNNNGPFLEWVRFSGRVLYPLNPYIYVPYMRRK